MYITRQKVFLRLKKNKEFENLVLTGKLMW